MLPRFYFHVRSKDGLHEDQQGVDLPSLRLAHHEAIEAAREILAEKILKGDVVDGDRFEIADADGKVLLKVPFRYALNLE